MRRIGIVIALVVATSAFGHGRHIGYGSFTASGENCVAGNFDWDGDEAYVEKQVINAGSIRAFKDSVENAPVAVIGGQSGSGYVIEACKVARRPEDLGAIRVTIDGGELRATGPEGRRWFVQYRILVPSNANVDITTESGPLAFRDVDGTIVARASNGPLALTNLSGNVNATTTNGPISINGGSGNMTVQAKNGPLAVNLDGGSWRGGTLDASTKNGPLALTIPRGYGSGVVVESNGGPLQCRAEGCERFRAERDAERHRGGWDDGPRRIELGSGAEAVRLSTVNGPVTIKDE